MSKAKAHPKSPKAKPSENSPGIPEAGHSIPKWMISGPEILDDQEVRGRQAWVAAQYPDTIIADIANAARFKNSKDIADMREFLLKAGYMFSKRKGNRQPRASFAPDRKQLETIARLADQPESELANLSDVSAISLWHPFQQVMTVLPSGRGYTTEYGLTIFERPQNDGSFIIEHLRPHQIEEAVYVIRCLAEQAAASFPAQKGGQPQIGVRQSWILSAQHFWREHSRLAFDPRLRHWNFVIRHSNNSTAISS